MEDEFGRCTIPPCVFRALKHLQTQQLAHNTSISRLETTTERFQPALTSPTVPQPRMGLNSNALDSSICVQEEVRK